MANPVGEKSWLAYIEETTRHAADLERRVNAIELYKRAVGAEPGSLRLWLAYCNYFWSLWSDSQSDEAGWPEEEQLMGREIFSFGAALDLWQQGYEAVKYRLSDSHMLWDRWISLEMELLSSTKTPEGIKRITQLYRNRLTTPHLTWDDTSQRFSSFLSEYNQSAWEDTMKSITSEAQTVKQVISSREPFEFKLQKAVRADDIEAQKSTLSEYLDWEVLQSRIQKKGDEGGHFLCRGLFSRALTGLFAEYEATWQQYIVFLSSSQSDTVGPDTLLETLRQAVQHCPSSGGLWNRYILYAEEARLSFAEIEAIKHAATSEDQLYKTGMESMIEMYVAWCGFLKRTAMDVNATDEAVDLADVGLTAALEDVAVVGNRLYGKSFQGDPKFRLERIYIQYLTEKKGAVEDARAQWKNLARIKAHADSHDFWLSYYMWEMFIFSSGFRATSSPTPSSAGTNLRLPALATAVLRRAASRKTIDWPEKILEAYLQHCNDYETPATVRIATDMVRNAEQGLQKRREKEQQEAAAYASYYSAQPEQVSGLGGAQVLQEADPSGASPEGSQRKQTKRALTPDARNEVDSASKRQKNNAEMSTEDRSDVPEAAPKRDRENATVIVSKLPADVTQTKVRQYFKEYGHINNVTALVTEDDEKSSMALIEFKSPEDAQSALLRDAKYFGESQISVQSGHDLTVYLANFPPSVDQGVIRALFSDCGKILSVRWPSLTVNTHRRFCYISFRDRDASAKAVKKDGTVLEGRYKLMAKYSDPAHKKNREGSVAEGREVHITNLDKETTEEELRNMFSKIGTVTRINLPKTLSGGNRGFAFLDLETKEQAQEAAKELSEVKLRNQIIRVEVSKESKVRPSARSTRVAQGSASPAPSPQDAEGDATMADGTGQSQSQTKPGATEIAARTVALMGLPDTVNDTRVRALVEPLGQIVKLVLQPGHGSAKIEFVDARTAGSAGLQLSSMELEGHKLRVGSLDELRHAKADRQTDKTQYGSKQDKQSGGAPPKGFMPPPQSIRRPVLGRPGPKRGLGFAPRGKGAVALKADENRESSGNKPVKKSNADFKAMFIKQHKDGDDDKEAGGSQGENGV